MKAQAFHQESRSTSTKRLSGQQVSPSEEKACDILQSINAKTLLPLRRCCLHGANVRILLAISGLCAAWVFNARLRLSGIELIPKFRIDLSDSVSFNNLECLR